MQEIAYAVRGFLTVRNSPLRVPLSGSLAVRADPDSGRFTGDLVLDPCTLSWTVPGGTLLSTTVQITAESPAVGQVDYGDRLSATVAVDAVIAEPTRGTQSSSTSCPLTPGSEVPAAWCPGASPAH